MLLSVIINRIKDAEKVAFFIFVFARTRITAKHLYDNYC